MWDGESGATMAVTETRGTMTVEEEMAGNMRTGTVGIWE